MDDPTIGGCDGRFGRGSIFCVAIDVALPRLVVDGDRRKEATVNKSSSVPRTRSLVLTALLAVTPVSGMLASGCATTRMAGEESDDARITGRVGRALTSDPEVRRYSIDVDTLDRVVTLRGVVENDNARSSAEQIARSTEGVRDVVNSLEVKSEATQEAEEERDDADDQPADIVLRTKIGARLSADPQIRRLNIDIDVIDGVVALSGVVHDETSKQEAEKLARNVEGVKEVKNELTVNPDDQMLDQDDGGEESPQAEPNTP